MSTLIAKEMARLGRRALVIDDDKFMLVVLADLLRELGIGQISTAANGSEGIEAFDRFGARPEVVLCDLSMPGSDGFVFMEKLAQRDYKGGVVLVSGMNERVRNSASLMARFHRLNILATLDKPVDKQALAEALERLH